jgi:hypothetical protein
VTFVDKEGKKHTYEVAAGDNLLDIAQENDLEMEGMLATATAITTIATNWIAKDWTRC